MFTENCKNIWGKHINFNSKNSKMYKIRLAHILLSKVMKTTGVQEKISVNGTDFTVYIFGHTDLENLQGYLNQFNKENNVEPIAV